MSLTQSCQFAVDTLSTSVTTCANMSNVNNCICDALDPESVSKYCSLPGNDNAAWSTTYTQAIAKRLDACNQAGLPVVPHTDLLVLPDGMKNPLGTNLIFSQYFHNGTCDNGNTFAYSLQALPNCINRVGECQAVGRKFSNDSMTELCVKDDFDYPSQLANGLAGKDYVNFQSFDNDAKCTGSVSSYFALALDQVQNVNLKMEDWNVGYQLSRVEGDKTKLAVKAYNGSEIKTVPLGSCVTFGQGSYVFTFPGSGPVVTTAAATATSALPVVTTTTAAVVTTTARSVVTNGVKSLSALGSIAFVTVFYIEFLLN